MNSGHSLHWRMILLMLILVGASSIVYGLVIYVANQELEFALLDTRVKQELAHVIQQRGRSDGGAHRPAADLRVYLRSRAAEDRMPRSFYAVEPGFYHDISLNGRYYHLGVRDLQKDRLYVALDVSRVEHKERRLEAFIIAGALLTPLTALWVAYWLSRKFVAPVSALAARLAELDPKQRNVRLAPAYHGYEVEIIARAFDRYMERLDGFVERERDFTTAASHELRSPLAVMQTSAELLAQDPGLTDAQTSVVSRIRRAVANMSETTEALLFLAREPASAVPISAVTTDLHALLPRIVDDYRQLAESRAITVSLSAPKPLDVPAPESHLSIVVSNLLRNALAHTQAGAVTVTLQDRRFTVADTGAGIAGDDLPHIFERHYRGLHSEGSGLGLFIVQRICQRYGWDLSVRSAPGAGTRMTVEF